MLTKVYINDFQSHKDTFLELVPGFNIITGPSGSGKSAFLRALNSLFYNNLTGTSFVRIGGKEDREEFYDVAIYTSDGVYVNRRKGPKINEYGLETDCMKDGTPIFDEANPRGKRFSSVKTDVPDEIRNALKIYPIQVDNNKEVNVQFCSQFDSPFMLLEAAPTKMKFLNVLSGTYAVDLAVKESNARLLQNKRAFEAADIEIARLEIESKEYDKKVQSLETANAYLKEHYAELKKLKETLGVFKVLQDTTSTLKTQFDKLNKLNELFSRVDADKVSKAIKRLVELRKLKAEYDNLVEANKALKKKEKLYASIDVDHAVLSIQKFKLTNNLLESYNKLLAAFKENSLQIRLASQSFNGIVEKYTAALEEVKVCPVCKSSITGSVIAHIKETL